MINCQGQHVFGVHVPAEVPPGHQGHAVGQQRHLQGVLHIVFRLGGAHQSPAVNIFHAVQIRKKVRMHGVSLLDKRNGFAIIIHENRIYR